MDHLRPEDDDLHMVPELEALELDSIAPEPEILEEGVVLDERDARGKQSRPLKGAVPDTKKGLPPDTKKRGALAKLALAAVVLGIGAAAFLQGGATLDETQYDAWDRHIVSLNQQDGPLFQTANQANVHMKHVAMNGTVMMVNEIRVSDDDLDTKTTDAVRAALASGNRAEAERIVAEAQQIPQGVDAQGAPLPPAQPQLSAGMLEAVASGDADFFHLYLYDNCAEDGDVVDILINNQSFSLIPINHQGATISIPIQKGVPTTIAIAGVVDGGGGITVGTRSSLGDYYTRSMMPGQTQVLGQLVR